MPCFVLALKGRKGENKSTMASGPNPVPELVPEEPPEELQTPEPEALRP
jgi:hypothetical protein